MHVLVTRKMTITEKRILRGNDRVSLIIVLTIASILINVKAAPPFMDNSRITTRQKETLASDSSSKKLSEEVGNPSELAWQAWLLVDGNANQQNSGTLDSASLLRRITPKSIFIAPALTACADGYQADTMNRCIKDVSIDKQAHHGFLIERLNAIFANAAKPQLSHISPSLSSSVSASSSSSSSSSSSANGPLQLNIPLLMPEASKLPRDNVKTKKKDENHEETSSTSDDETKNVKDDEYSNGDEKISHDEIVTVYELEDDVDEASRKNESDFSSRNESPAKVDDKTMIKPTKQDDSIDYKISEDDVSIDENTKNHDETTDSADNGVSPTVVLLLSPTKLPASSLSGNNDVIVAHNSSLGRIIIKVENATGNMTGKEIIRVSVPENLSHSSLTDDKSTIFDNSTTESTIDHREIISDDKIVVSPLKDDEKIIAEESTEIYDEDDVNYDEDSTELYDEILKHSEAGITVTVKSNDEMKNDDESSTIDATMPLPNNHGNSSERESNEGEISSEVSVNRDFVRETTLVGFPPKRIYNLTFESSKDAFNRSANVETSEMLVLPLREATLLDNSNNDQLKNSRDEEKIVDHRSKMENITIEDNIFPADASTLKNFNVDISNVSVHLSTLNETSSFDTRLIDNTDVNSKMEKNYTKFDENPDIAKPEVIYPVRGIEEAFEDSLPVDSSSKLENVETMIAASTNAAAGTIITLEDPKFPASSFASENDNDEIRPTHETSKTTEVPLKPSRLDEIYDYEIPSRDHSSQHPQGVQRDDAPSTIIRTMADEPHRSDVNYDDSSRIVSKDEKSSPSSLQRDKNYVRFPNDDFRGTNRVRFPSDEANSITNDYKERNRRPYVNRDDEIYNGSRFNTGSHLSPNKHDEESYWWSSSQWRDNKDETQRSDDFYERSRLAERSRNRSPMLLRFWTRMPLLRDPSLSFPASSGPIGQFRQTDVVDDDDSSINDPRSPSSKQRQQSRRGSNYRYGETSNYDLGGSLVRNKSAMGG